MLTCNPAWHPNTRGFHAALMRHAAVVEAVQAPEESSKSSNHSKELERLVEKKKTNLDHLRRGSVSPETIGIGAKSRELRSLVDPLAHVVSAQGTTEVKPCKASIGARRSMEIEVPSRSSVVMGGHRVKGPKGSD